MSQLEPNAVKKALAEGRIVMIENHSSIEMLRRYPSQLAAEDLNLRPGKHEFVLISITIGNNSPTEWLVLDEPSVPGTVYEGAALLYFLGLHNTGKIVMHLQAPAHAQVEA